MSDSDRDSVVTVDELDNDFDDGGPAEDRKDWKSDGDREKRAASPRKSPGARGPYFGELCTRILYIQSKKFFIDIKSTRRGIIVKFSEIQLNGSKSRMTMELNVVKELHEKLCDFIEQYTSLGPRSQEPSRTTIKSESILTPERRYYLDLKENSRGRFLKISMIMGPPTHERAEIVIPAQGMIDLRDVLTDVLQQCDENAWETIHLAGGEREAAAATRSAGDSSRSRRESERPTWKDEEGLSLEAPRGKTYYAAVIKRKQGVFLRISEVRQNFKTAINVPQDSWERFLFILKKNAGELCQTADELSTDAAMVTVSHDDDDADDVIWTGTSQTEVF